MIFCLLCSLQVAQAQSALETRPLYEGQSAYNFTSDWQYLSTDIYLFQPERFAPLLAELSESGGGGRLRGKSPQLEYLCITATLSNLKLLGTQELSYPIFAFHLKQGAEGEGLSRATQVRESIRIIDNLPLSNDQEVVEATLQGEARLSSRDAGIQEMVASQLLSLATITNPTEAVLKLVGEFGRFLNSSVQETQYEFASTIRLYEGDNFNQQLHSIKVYAFSPPGNVRLHMDATALDQFLGTRPTRVDRQTLESLVNFRRYPYVVVVNYKSKYQLPVVVGDAVNNSLVEQRRQQVETDYQTQLINAETYRQELAFIAYLEQFAGLKQLLGAYSLAFEIGNTRDISRTLFAILQRYRELYQTIAERDRIYASNAVYQNLFRKEYRAILETADLYLEKDHHLKSSKLLVQVLLSLENEHIPDSLGREQALAAFDRAVLPDMEFLTQSVVGQEIVQRRTMLEDEHWRVFFEEDCRSIKQLSAAVPNPPLRQELLRRAQESNCKRCRDQTLEHIQHYDTRYRDEWQRSCQKSQALLRLECDKLVLSYYKNRACLSSVTDALEPAYAARLQKNMDEYNASVKRLEQLLLEPCADSPESAQVQNELFERQSDQVSRNLYNLCALESAFCQCLDGEKP